MRGEAPLAAPDTRDADTLLLPRLASLDWVGAKLRVFSMGSSPTPAQAEQFALNRYMVKSDTLTATVITDASGNPIEVEIKDGNQTARSKHISGGCSTSVAIEREIKPLKHAL